LNNPERLEVHQCPRYAEPYRCFVTQLLSFFSEEQNSPEVNLHEVDLQGFIVILEISSL